MLFMANTSNEAIINAIDPHSQDSSMVTSNAWAGSAGPSDLSSPTSSRTGTTWPDNTAVDHPQYSNPFSLNNHSLYTGLPAHDFFGSVHDPNGTNTAGGPFPTYDTDDDLPTGADVVDIDPNPTHGGFPPNQVMGVPETSPPQAAKAAAAGGVSISPIGQCNPATTYEVSINMVCTGTQLESVLVNVASAGTGVTLKIDPKS
ncbi:hypothetical protein DV735_g966, partial [Chaetothyriales sp. CBS 134920]